MSKYKKSALVLFVMLLAVLLVPMRQLVSWGQDATDPKSGTQDTKEQYPIADSTEPESGEPIERVKRQKRNKKHNQDTTAVSPMIVQTAEGYEWPADFSPIPAALSNAVVVGKISEAKAYLSEDKNSVYSEFTVRIDEVLKNDNSHLAQGDLVIAERKGGRVRYPSGQISWLFVVGQGAPRLGGRYVLFLKRTDDEQVLCIMTGYEIRAGRINPLDYSPGVVRFERYAGWDTAPFLNEVRNKITGRSPASSQ